MKSKITKHYADLKGRDGYGKFLIRIQTDFSQFTLETSNGYAYIDIDKSALKEIRDFITELLEDSNQADA
ncbi:hypothetical protein [Flavobacterium sp. 14A]|uniref:hypothetical protein n=1 Tax=Flavobacterium sp. 14A TaxID=2735896 RepID=UPI00156EC712|nr:hypothetical protein [Flavobacterium sp. 14A]NRT11513.1 hypothetical protein [Flavobacterium sp. 14A]